MKSKRNITEKKVSLKIQYKANIDSVQMEQQLNKEYKEEKRPK